MEEEHEHVLEKRTPRLLEKRAADVHNHFMLAAHKKVPHVHFYKGDVGLEPYATNFAN